MSEETKTGFGPKFIGATTPDWAKWFFRLFFYVTSMSMLGIGIFTNLEPALKLQIGQWVTFANLCAHGFSKMFGIKIEDTDYDKN